MLAIEGQQLINSYLAWLNEGFRHESGDGHTMITTPFLDPHNDEIQIFIERKNGSLRLTDDGYTISDLRGSGLEINTEKRLAHIQQILNGFGVHQEQDELYVTTTPRDYPQKKHNLLQAILAVHDLTVMGQTHVLQFFEEDVAAFLNENSIPFFRGLKLSGKSGFDHHFDFGLPAIRQRHEGIIQAFNSLSREQATSIAFAVNDVRLVRGKGNFDAYAIINDRENRPTDDYIDALRAYGIKPFFWNDRNALLKDVGSN